MWNRVTTHHLGCGASDKPVHVRIRWHTHGAQSTQIIQSRKLSSECGSSERYFSGQLRADPLLRLYYICWKTEADGKLGDTIMLTVCLQIICPCCHGYSMNVTKIPESAYIDKSVSGKHMATNFLLNFNISMYFLRLLFFQQKLLSFLTT